MPIKPKTKKKRKTKKNPYTIQFSKEERERLKEFAEKHGYLTESKVIKDALDTIYRNPIVIEPTEGVDPKILLENLIDKRKESFEEQIQFFKDIQSRLTNVERLLEAFALKSGMSKKDIKKAQKKDMSAEAVFE